MAKRIPDNEIWKQPNLGDKFGPLRGTFNIDLSDEQGKIKLTPRLMINTKNTDTDLKTPFAFAYNDALSKWHAGCGDVMFVGGSEPSDAFVQDAATSAPSFETTSRPDLTVFNMSDGNDYTFGMASELYRLALNGSSWGAAITSIGGATAGAPLIAFKGRLYFRVSSKIMGSIDNVVGGPTAVVNGTSQYSINFNDGAQSINCGCKTSDYLWIGNIAAPGTKCVVYQYNGSSTSVTGVYEIDARGILAMCSFRNVPYLLDSEGVLRKFSGSFGFTEVARLPFDKKKLLPSPISSSPVDRLCHYNGLIADDDRILINIKSTYADTNSTTDELVPSGIWEYNEINGLFHHASPSLWENGVSASETDFGAAKVAKIGAIRKAEHASSSDNGSLLTGYQYYTNASSTAIAIFVDDLNNTKIKAGHIILSRQKASGLKDKWAKLFPILRKFLNSGDKLVAKWRIDKDEPTEGTITWASTTSFTSSVTGYAVGDEVCVLNGVGAGKCVHVTDITGTTFTVDSIVTGATGTAKARFNTWKKAGSFNSQSDNVADAFPLSDAPASPVIDLKIYMEWTGKNEIFEFLLTNEINTNI
jgi:hypothetical protein